MVSCYDRSGNEAVFSVTESLSATLNTCAPPYIIIPVYRNLAVTRDCLESVRRHSAEYRVVVINDASPEPELTSFVQQWAAGGHVHLIENPANQGFVCSVNQGLAVDPQRDVILLNSDTVVTSGWVEKLQSWATADERVATVTPFSNNATICSYPHICCNNALPDGLSADEINTLFEAAYHQTPATAVELPTGVGFCLYIRRTCIEQAGTFNAAVFGRGYGEENDFCQRCIQKGGLHLAALDTFIYHQGETSFGSDAACRCEAAQEKLSRLHPKYADQVKLFLQCDPLAVIRRMVDVRRFAANPRPGVLLIGHRLGGGTRQHLMDLLPLWAARHWHPFTLEPVEGGGCRLASGLPGEEFTLTLSGAGWYKALLMFLPRLQIRCLHYHHLLGYSRKIYELPRAAGLPYDITLHDYFALCPHSNGFAPHTAYYCGLEPHHDCQACLQEGFRASPLYQELRALGQFPDITVWRTFHHRFLKQARRIITPSQAAAAIFERFFPSLPLQVHPHPETRLAPRRRPNVPGNILNVGLVGGISPQKGRFLLDELVKLSRRRRLPLRWVVLGVTDTEYRRNDGDYLVTGPYQRFELPELFDRYQIHVGLLPVCWPETFSYVLSEYWFAGIPVIVPNLGALGERMLAVGGGWLLPKTLTAPLIIDQLLQIMNTPHDFFLRCQKAQQFQEVLPSPDLPVISDWNTELPTARGADVDESLLRLVIERTCQQHTARARALLASEKNELTLTRNHVINLENSLQINLTAVDFLNKTNTELQTALENHHQREVQAQARALQLESELAALKADSDDQRHILRRLKLHWVIHAVRRLRSWRAARR